jgi:pimeloyl-[acyl-carrier protein] methyl ester esterase
MSAGMRAKDLVLLHGWGAGAGIWREFAQRLAPRFRVHALDLPGYGAQPDSKPYTLDALADRVARLAPRRCGVIGWSLGGQVALAWACRAGRQVERAALIATTPCFVRRPGWPHGIERGVLEGFARSLKEDPAALLGRFALLQARGDVAARRVALRLRAEYAARGGPDGAVLERGLDILLNTDLRVVLAAVKQPVLALHGARDAIVPVAAGRRLAAALPHARFQLLRGCAHAPFLSRPARIAKALRAFFDE